MAEDLHKRIVHAVRDALEDANTSWVGGDVTPYRVYPVDGSTLPYTSVWLPSEEVQRESGADNEDDPALVESEVTLMVAGFFHAPIAQLDGLIGQHMKQVRLTLAAGIELDGVKVAFDMRGIDKEYEGADAEYTEVLMRFVGEIAYLKNAPDTLSWQ